MRHHRRNAHARTPEEASPPMYQTPTERWIEEHHIRSDIEHCADDLWYVYKDSTPRTLHSRPISLLRFCPIPSLGFLGTMMRCGECPELGRGPFPFQDEPSLLMQRRACASSLGVPLSLITILPLPCLLFSLTDRLAWPHPLVRN